MDHVQLLLCFFELVAQPSDLLCTGGLVFLQFGLQHGQFFHSLLDSVFVFAEHHFGGSVFRFQCLIDILEVYNFLLEVVETRLEIVLFFLDLFEFLFENIHGGLSFFLRKSLPYLDLIELLCQQVLLFLGFLQFILQFHDN